MAEEFNDIEEISEIEQSETRKPDPAELKVATKGDAKKLAGAIFAKFKQNGYCKVRAIGDGAIGVGFRAATIACNYLKLADVDACITGAFFVVEIAGQKRNGSVINIEVR